MTPKYITAYLSEDTKPIIMKDLAKIRESVLTEDDLAKEPIFSSQPSELYQQQKRKHITMMKESKVNTNTLTDQVAGTLNPIVYRLNKGLDIKTGSHEHKWLKELLEKINNS